MSIAIIIGAVVLAVVLLRAFGAWMFRIDEILKNQKQSIEVQKQLVEQMNRIILIEQEEAKKDQ